MSEATQAVDIEETVDVGGLVPISVEHLDLLIRSARFAQRILSEADARDSMSSSSVRALGRAWGLGQQALFTPEFEELVLGFDDGDEIDADELLNEQVQAGEVAR